MTKEEKQLLLNDLCARLPYYTELYSNVADDNWAILTPVIIFNLMNADDDLVIKPYLRPMSSMTDEERDEFRTLGGVMSHNVQNDTWAISAFAPEAYDWLLAHHFDYRGLIEKSLAIVAPDNMYK